MPIDTSIYSNIKGPELMTPGQAISLQNVAQQGQLQKIQLEEAQQNQVKKNMLREVMQGATDPQTGRLTPDGLAKVTAIDPDIGLKLTGQQEQLRLQDVARNEKKNSLLSHVGTAYVSAYDRYLQQTGGNKEQATQLAQKETQELINQLDSSGSLASQGFDTETIAKLRQLRDPEQTRTIVTGLGGKIPESAPTNRQERKRISGTNEIQEEWDPSSKSWRKIGEGPRFAGTSEEGKAPAGYRFSKTKPGELEAIPGGPAAQKALGFEGENGKLMAALAERGVALPAGFRSAQQQLGLLNALRDRNPDLSTDQIAEKVKGGQIDLGNEKTWGRVAAGIGGKVAYAEKEIEQTIPLVREASAKLPRGEFIPFNKLQQMGQEAFSNPDLAEYRMYMTSLSNAYDMLAARGGTDMEKRKENRKNFEMAQSMESLERVMQAVRKEAQASGRAAQQSLRPGQGGGDNKAPQSAIDYLKANPESKDAFKAKYGYVPDGI